MVGLTTATREKTGSTFDVYKQSMGTMPELFDCPETEMRRCANLKCIEFPTGV